MDILVDKIYLQKIRGIFDDEKTSLDRLANEMAATGHFNSSHLVDRALEVLLNTSEIRIRSILTAHQEVFETTKKKPDDNTVHDVNNQLDELLRDEIKRVHQKMNEICARLSQSRVGQGHKMKIDQSLGLLASAVKQDFEIWKSKENVRQNQLLGNTVFVIMRLGFEGADVRRFYEEAILPSVADHKLIAKPVDKTEGLESISTRILNMIDEAPFVIADLTYERPNCYFEAGYALGKGKPVLFTARLDHDPRKLPRKDGDPRVHFDVDAHNITYWDPEKMESARTQIADRIRILIAAK